MASLIIDKISNVDLNPSSTFRVVITQMSGDGDLYKTKHFDFIDTSRAINFVLLAYTIREIQEQDDERVMCEIRKKILEQLDCDTIDSAIGTSHLEDKIYDICGYDVMCEDRLASVEDIDIFWFNQHCIKYDVKFEK